MSILPLLIAQILRGKLGVIIGGLRMLEEYEGFIGTGAGSPNEEEWI